MTLLYSLFLFFALSKGRLVRLIKPIKAVDQSLRLVADKEFDGGPEPFSFQNIWVIFRDLLK